MRNQTIGGFRSLNAFVAYKLERFTASQHDFKALFGLMFSEPENVMFESSKGYKIEKTTYGECKAAALRRAAALEKILDGMPADSVIGLLLECAEIARRIKSDPEIEIKDDLMGKSPLYDALVEWRLQKAQDADVPAYTIAHNTTLKTIAQVKPVTLAELKVVKGMGVKKVKLHGDEIINIVLQYLNEE